ncbi:ABC transporter permease [Bacillus sp. MUM 13]|uniref:ABC transporter permease n=1 Tax=Bacillus sp. MUM 13 TaxID=1678001 RepID=UPI0008F5A67D|nr:ABC transporter permease [Bacillus sp. MUM 13]OIK14942.1 ABC transporter permease [Bacillus sp. MUM 13]
MKSKWKQWSNNYGLFILAAIIFISLWELIVKRGDIPSFILPAPSAIFISLNENSSILLQHVTVTLQEVLIGFILSAAGGILLGIAMHFSKVLEKICYPFLVISQTVPLIAISPIFIMWFGYSIWGKVAVTILTAFFPIAVSTYDGLRLGQSSYSDLLRTMGAGRFQIFRKVQIPLALPMFLSGMKMAAVYSVVGATIGEWLGGSAGLGYFSRRMSGNLQADAVFASVFLLSLLGMIFFFLITVIEKKVLKHHFHTDS